MGECKDEYITSACTVSNEEVGGMQMVGLLRTDGLVLNLGFP